MVTRFWQNYDSKGAVTCLQGETLIKKNFIKETFEEHLTKAIVTAAKQWSLSSGTILGLSKEKYNVEVSFMVKKSTGGGIEFEIWGIGADLSVDSENSAVHTVSLTFE